MEAVFKALADTSRRTVLDSLYDDNGQSLQQLCKSVDFSRQGLSKHLRILENANLVVSEFHGREKLHYLNALPLHEISERWMAKYSLDHLSALSTLKQTLEGPAMNKDKFIYETYINSSIDDVWQALTNAEFTSQYFMATHVESSWKKGSPIKYYYQIGGEVAVEGKIIELKAPFELIISWHVLYDETIKAEQPSRVSFSLQENAGQTRLRVVHDQFPDNSVLFEQISQGWPWIISNLKSLLETGKVLERFED